MNLRGKKIRHYTENDMLEDDVMRIMLDDAI